MLKCKWSNEAPKPPKRAKMLRIVVSENHSHLLLEQHSNVEADQQLQHINCKMKAFRLYHLLKHPAVRSDAQEADGRHC